MFQEDPAFKKRAQAAPVKTKPKAGAKRASGRCVVLTGATGGIGRHVHERLKDDFEVLCITRNASRDCDVQCDLTTEAPRIAGKKVDWICHLATTKKVAPDMAMLENLMTLAKEKGVTKFVYFSSWTVSFPDKTFVEEYIRMKRLAEAAVREACAKNGITPYIVRPSVVIGAKGLEWQSVIDTLSSVSAIVPRSWCRCFVEVSDVAEAVHELMVDPESQEGTLLQLIGRRRPMYEVCQGGAGARMGLVGLLLLPLALAVRLVLGLIMFVGSFFSTFMNSFYLSEIQPSSVEEFTSWFNKYNKVLPTGARCYVILHKTAYGWRGKGNHWDGVLTVNTLQLNKIKSISENEVVAEAGVRFVHLMPKLYEQDKSLASYPNYWDISMGACVATPVHGHSNKHSTVASLMNWVKYFDIETQKVVTVHKGTPAFRDLMFNTHGKAVVLEVSLGTTARKYYRKEKTHYDFKTTPPEVLFNASQQGDSCEIRMHVPAFGKVTVTHWHEASKDHPEVRAELNRGEINWLFLVGFKLGFKLMYNAEWYFNAEDFKTFWTHYQTNWWAYGWYKILVRFSAVDNLTHSHSTHAPVIAVDIGAFMHNVHYSAAMMKQYSTRMHGGKFITDQEEVTKPLLSASSKLVLALGVACALFAWQSSGLSANTMLVLPAAALVAFGLGQIEVR